MAAKDIGTIVAIGGAVCVLTTTNFHSPNQPVGITNAKKEPKGIAAEYLVIPEENVLESRKSEMVVEETPVAETSQDLEYPFRQTFLGRHIRFHRF